MKKITNYLFFALAAILVFACCHGHKNGGDYKSKENVQEEDFEQSFLAAMDDNTMLQSLQIMYEGLVMTDASADEKYLTLEYSCDESQISIEVFNGNKDLLKEAVFEKIEQNDPKTLEMVDLLKATHRGITYKYVGDRSGKTVTICVEPDEL